jgi:hypothetical protein
MTASAGTVTVEAATPPSGNSFSETFTNLDAWTTLAGTPSISSGRLLLNAIGEGVYVATDTSRGFYVEFDLQVPAAPDDAFDSVAMVVSSQASNSSGNRYEIAFGNYTEVIDFDPFPAYHYVIAKNGTILQEASVGAENTNNRRYRVEFASNGNIVLKHGATGSTPTTTIVTYTGDTASPHTSFSHLLFVAGGVTSNKFVDNVTVGGL